MDKKKMTIKYWNSLEKGTRERAITAVFPTMPAIVRMLMDDPKPNPKDGCWWMLVFKKVKATNDDWYKVCVNGTYYR